MPAPRVEPTLFYFSFLSFRLLFHSSEFRWSLLTRSNVCFDCFFCSWIEPIRWNNTGYVAAVHCQKPQSSNSMWLLHVTLFDCRHFELLFLVSKWVLWLMHFSFGQNDGRTLPTTRCIGIDGSTVFGRISIYTDYFGYAILAHTDKCHTDQETKKNWERKKWVKAIIMQNSRI